jgi:hypothetical protein
MVSEIAVHSCRTRSRPDNPGPDTASFDTTFHKRVSNICDWRIRFDMHVAETGPAVWASFVKHSNHQVSHIPVTDATKLHSSNSSRPWSPRYLLKCF